MSQLDVENTKEILFPDDETLNRSNSMWFSNRLRNEFIYNQIEKIKKWEPELAQTAAEHKVYNELADFIRKHIKSVGQEQAIKDFQCGLNLLHKDITCLIKEDGIFGINTFMALNEMLQHYPLEVIKQKIKHGAKSNAVIDYNYSLNDETEEILDQINNNLKKENI